MKKTCPNCRLVNFKEATNCARCGSELSNLVQSQEKTESSLGAKIIRRALVCLLVAVFCLLGFYLSLIVSAKKLTYDEKKMVGSATSVLKAKGFGSEVFLLSYITAFRSNDNWLNASVEKENAYAATNFPFEIMTLYPEFFTVPMDETERAAILLHEAQHLKGAEEKDAYEYVWKNRQKLGWTKDKYEHSLIWRNVRKQTKEYVPNLFMCADKEYADCTE